MSKTKKATKAETPAKGGGRKKATPKVEVAEVPAETTTEVTTPPAAATPKEKKKRKKSDEAAPAEKPPRERKVETPDPQTLRPAVDEAHAALAVAEAEANELTEKARVLLNGARDAYRNAVAPYREACRKAGVPCEFERGRGANVSEKVTFEVEKVSNGVRVQVKGKPETEEFLPFAELKASINKAAYRYTNKHVGLREEVGNKGGSLSNRLRAAIR